MKKKIQNIEVSGIERLNEEHFLLNLYSKTNLPEILPGQFAQILIENSRTTFLRRPFSVHNISYSNNTITFLVQIVGDGTRSLSRLREGDMVSIVYPLGNSFTMGAEDNVLLVGGGCGVAPLLFLARYLYENGHKMTILIGGKTRKDILRIREYQKYGNVLITTEDGSLGEKGLVTQHPLLQAFDLEFDKIYTCGPELMMKAVGEMAKIRNIECEVSLERIMACGIGACLCCVIDTPDGNRCVCTEGPVFNVNELKW